jgi:hypothetical protein
MQEEAIVVKYSSGKVLLIEDIGFGSSHASPNFLLF